MVQIAPIMQMIKTRLNIWIQTIANERPTHPGTNQPSTWNEKEHECKSMKERIKGHQIMKKEIDPFLSSSYLAFKLTGKKMIECQRTFSLNTYIGKKPFYLEQNLENGRHNLSYGRIMITNCVGKYFCTYNFHTLYFDSIHTAQ